MWTTSVHLNVNFLIQMKVVCRNNKKKNGWKIIVHIKKRSFLSCIFHGVKNTHSDFVAKWNGWNGTLGDMCCAVAPFLFIAVKPRGATGWHESHTLARLSRHQAIKQHLRKVNHLLFVKRQLHAILKRILPENWGTARVRRGVRCALYDCDIMRLHFMQRLQFSPICAKMSSAAAKKGSCPWRRAINAIYFQSARPDSSEVRVYLFCVLAISVCEAAEMEFTGVHAINRLGLNRRHQSREN